MQEDSFFDNSSASRVLQVSTPFTLKEHERALKNLKEHQKRQKEQLEKKQNENSKREA